MLFPCFQFFFQYFRGKVFSLILCLVRLISLIHYRVKIKSKGGREKGLKCQVELHHKQKNKEQAHHIFVCVVTQ